MVCIGMHYLKDYVLEYSAAADDGCRLLHHVPEPEGQRSSYRCEMPWFFQKSKSRGFVSVGCSLIQAAREAYALTRNVAAS